MKLKNKETIIQLLFWPFYFCMALFGRGTYWDGMESGNLALIILSFPVTFFINAYWLIPKYLNKRKWFYYVSGLLILLIVLEMARIFFVTYPDFVSAETLLFGKQNVFPAFFMGFIVSFIYISTRDWMMSIGIIEQLKSEKLATELAFLRSQVDPHFLFNTLNNLYALALEEKGFKTADGIAKLGGLMRYNLHDSQENLISLDKEMEYIEKYIALQQLRLNTNSDIKFNIQKNEGAFHTFRIAPMLLIPFIENAFKYGISPAEKTSVDIYVALENNVLVLRTMNSIVNGPATQPNNGIGLQNVRKRLELVYAGNYSLTINTADGVFFAHLEIKLQDD